MMEVSYRDFPTISNDMSMEIERFKIHAMFKAKFPCIYGVLKDAESIHINAKVFKMYKIY